MATVYLGLGSNLGNREEYLIQALISLNSAGVDVISCSSIYETVPVGFQSNSMFYNMVVEVEVGLSPLELLKLNKIIESDLGRIKLLEDSYESRTIDIDILFFGSEVINTRELVIPHPEFANRKFVLVPLIELNPLLVNPLTKKTIKQHFDETSDSSEAIKVVTNTEFLKKLRGAGWVKKK